MESKTIFFQFLNVLITFDWIDGFSKFKHSQKGLGGNKRPGVRFWLKINTSTRVVYYHVKSNPFPIMISLTPIYRGVQKRFFFQNFSVPNFFGSDFCADHENDIHFYQKSKFSWFFSIVWCHVFQMGKITKLTQHPDDVFDFSIAILGVENLYKGKKIMFLSQTVKTLWPFENQSKMLFLEFFLLRLCYLQFLHFCL